MSGAARWDRMRSVWYRRAREAHSFSGTAACDEVFLQDEWMLFQRNYWALGEQRRDLLWVNSPSAARQAENKLVQLNAAIACGLNVPATLVSNDPREVAAFRTRHRKVIYKPFSLHSWVDEAGSRGCIAHARLLDPNQVIDDASIRVCPGIYQAFVEKVADIRVTVIGRRWFAARLGKGRGEGFVDWRSHVRSEEFSAQACALPGPIWEKLQQFMDRLGIAYGAFDLVLDADGDLHFLEVNQGGQFLFVERWLPDQPLLQAMCSMLSSGSPDYALDAHSTVSYADFRASDAYAQWQQQARDCPPTDAEVRSTLTVEPCAV